MALPNEVIFLLHAAVAFAAVVAAGRLGRDWLVALIVTCTILMNIDVWKQMTLFGLPVTGGNVLYTTVFFANDCLNEHYGRRVAIQAVWKGFAAGFFVVAMTSFMLWYAPNEFDSAQPHMAYLFDVGGYPRIVAFSMLSYILSQWMDARLYDAIRRRTGTHRLLWLRTNGSTWLSQAFDTLFFTTAALTGIIINSWAEWLGAVAFAYLVKVATAVLDTPFLYLTTWRPLRPPGSIRAMLSTHRAV